MKIKACGEFNVVNGMFGGNGNLNRGPNGAAPGRKGARMGRWEVYFWDFATWWCAIQIWMDWTGGRGAMT